MYRRRGTACIIDRQIIDVLQDCLGTSIRMLWLTDTRADMMVGYEMPDISWLPVWPACLIVIRPQARPAVRHWLFLSV